MCTAVRLSQVGVTGVDCGLHRDARLLRGILDEEVFILRLESSNRLYSLNLIFFVRLKGAMGEPFRGRIRFEIKPPLNLKLINNICV